LASALVRDTGEGGVRAKEKKKKVPEVRLEMWRLPGGSRQVF
jgi:hypothetical protein